MAPVNLQAIEDFQGDFEQDQVHFTCLSGIYYVQHLADRVLSMLEGPAPAKQVRYIVTLSLILLLENVVQFDRYLYCSTALRSIIEILSVSQF